MNILPLYQYLYKNGNQLYTLAIWVYNFYLMFISQ